MTQKIGSHALKQEVLDLIGTGGGGGGSSALAIQEDGAFVVSGTAISFDKDLVATAVGAVAHINIPAGTFSSGSHTHSAGSTLVYATEATTNPPTEAELISAFGTPDTFHSNGSIGHLNDANAALNEYLILSDGGHYWINTLSKASVASLSISGTTGTVDASTNGVWYGRASIEVASDGNWLLVYREGPSHDDNSVEVLHIRFSDNQGSTWTNRNTYIGGAAVTGFPMYPPGAGTGTTRGPGEPWLMLAPNNDLLLEMWWVDYGTSHSGTYQSRSTDNGQTWSTPVSINFSGIAGDANIFMTDDYFVYNGVIYAGARVYSDLTYTNGKNIFVKSTDNGTTWEYVSDISSFTTDTEEVALEYLGNNTIIALLRAMDYTATYKTISTDMGLTWSAVVDISSTFDSMGRARMMTRSHLKGYSNWWEDQVLLVFGHVFATPGSPYPRTNCVWISQDGGTTWSGPNYVDAEVDDAGYGDMQYSSTLGRYVFISYQGTNAEASLMQYNLLITGI